MIADMHRVSAHRDGVPPMMSIDAIGVRQEDDHILSRSIHDRIASAVAEDAEKKMRRIWIVPACTPCNQNRRGKLEDIGYLIRVFGFFLEANAFEPHHEAYEAALFIEAAKVAHLHLRWEADFRIAQEKRA
jgi:hypothetical protein